MGDKPVFRDDNIALAQAQRAMIEFSLPTYGRYMFHPHQHWLADRGAMGWFAAV
jgi:FtsP/CotA-like multicopper oxidase with cupredoxin domain